MIVPYRLLLYKKWFNDSFSVGEPDIGTLYVSTARVGVGCLVIGSLYDIHFPVVGSSDTVIESPPHCLFDVDFCCYLLSFECNF